MKKNIEISKIILFDDKSENIENKYIQGAKKIMERSLSKAKTLCEFSVADDLDIEFYYLDKTKTKCISRTLTDEKEIDWYNHLANIFKNDEIGYLVLCDYGWCKGEFENANIKIYEHVKQKKNVVFVCYTTAYDYAGEWLETIRNEKHECKIIDILCTMPRDVDGKLRSLEEAILDEW